MSGNGEAIKNFAILGKVFDIDLWIARFYFPSEADILFPVLALVPPDQLVADLINEFCLKLASKTTDKAS